MRDIASAMFRLLRSRDPLAIVWYETLAERDEIIARIRMLATIEDAPELTARVEDAFERPSTRLLVTPEDEPAALAVLDARRENLRDRTAPAIVFLLRGGAAERTLGDIDRPALASWVQGLQFHPHALAQVDRQQARGEFEAKNGRSPERWLEEFRTGALPDTLVNNLKAQWAAFLTSNA